MASGTWISVGDPATAPESMTIPIAAGLLCAVPIASAELFPIMAPLSTFAVDPALLAGSEACRRSKSKIATLRFWSRPTRPAGLGVEAALAAGAAAELMSPRDHRESSGGLRARPGPRGPQTAPCRGGKDRHCHRASAHDLQADRQSVPIKPHGAVAAGC